MNQKRKQDDPLEKQHSYILDPENVAEMARLEIQGRLLTESMGGLLPERGNTLPAEWVRVLDLGCGPGEWVRQMASSFPQAQVTGLDISQIMIAYAQVLAQQNHLENAHFVRGSLLQPLPFPEGSFDLVNARLLVGVLQQDRWPAFLQACRHVLRTGGVIRLTEGGDPGWQANKPASQAMLSWLLDMIPRSGYGFATATSPGWHMREGLSTLLAEGGWKAIAVREETLDFSFGTPLAASQRRNILTVSEQARVVLLRLGIATEADFIRTYEEMKKELREQDFQLFSHMNTLTATA